MNGHVQKRQKSVSPSRQPLALLPTSRTNTPPPVATLSAAVVGAKAVPVDTIKNAKTRLPAELLCHVFQYLTCIGDLVRASHVCSQWYHAACDPFIWRNVELVVGSCGIVTTEMDHINETNLDLKAAYKMHYEKRRQVIKSSIPITNRFLKTFADRLHSIRTVTFVPVFGELWSEEDIYAVLNNIPNIKSINLTDCTSLTKPKFMETMLSLCPDIEKLVLRNCRDIKHYAFSIITGALPKLNYLDISNCAQLGDVSILTLVDDQLRRPTLKTLKMCNMLSISRAAFRAVADGVCKGRKSVSNNWGLEVLDLSNNFLVDDSVLEGFWKGQPEEEGEEELEGEELTENAQPPVPLELHLNNCEQITLSDCLKLEDANVGIRLVQNAKLRDHSAKSVLEYLNALLAY